MKIAVGAVWMALGALAATAVVAAQPAPASSGAARFDVLVGTGKGEATSGVTVTPYVEGAGTRKLTLTSGGAPAERAPATQTAQVAPPAPAVQTAQAGGTKPAPAAATVDTLKFEITRFDVQGNTLLGQPEVDRALAPFLGGGKDFGDVQRALEALQLAYQREGYGGVEIRLPEQELDRGIVRLRVIEPRIGKITVEGNEHFSSANILRSVPALRSGETPRSREIAKGIRLANENPAKQSTVVLRATEREDVVDATVRVVDVNPRRFSLSLDNTGSEETHRFRLGMGFQHANAFDLDHVITAQFITSPANPNDVQVYGLGYRVPLPSLGDSIEFVAGYSNVDSGTVENLFVVAGAGTVFALRYNQNLPRWREVEHRLVYGFDYRAYQNQVNPAGGTAQLVPDITLSPVSLTYSGGLKVRERDIAFYASVAKNIPSGNDSSDDIFKLPGQRFEEGTSGYLVFRAGGALSGEIASDWQFRVRFDAQYTDDALVSAEQFAIGGADNVRGFGERYVSNDKGYRSNWEIYTPDLSKYLGLDGRLRLLAFYDTGTVRRNRELANETQGSSLDGAGIGLRLNYKTNFTLRFDLAHVMHDGTQFGEPDGRKSSKKGHFSMAYVW